MKPVAVAGTITLDTKKYVDRFPKKSELSYVRKIEQQSGGIVPNTGIALAKLNPDIEVQLYALLGEDQAGSQVLEELKRYSNINTDFIQKKGRTPNTDAICDLEDGTRTFFYDSANSKYIDDSLFSNASFDFSLLHIGYLLALPALDQPDQIFGTKMAKLLANMQQRGIKTSIDVVTEGDSSRYAGVEQSLKYANYCVINELEASKITGIEVYQNKRLLKEKLKECAKAIKDMGVEDWVVVHCPTISVAFDGKKIQMLEHPQVAKKDIVQSVGAGDVYAAGIITGIIQKRTMKEAMLIAEYSARMLLTSSHGKHDIEPYS